MKQGIVFDMDKCIGYFTQVAIYQEIIEELTRPLKVKEQFDLFDICREIFRPGIFNVFKYLAKEKKKKKLKIIMYTNNNGPPSWATNIRKYIEHKIKHKLFDRTIKGWKYNNKIVEDKRIKATIVSFLIFKFLTFMLCIKQYIILNCNLRVIHIN